MRGSAVGAVGASVSTKKIKLFDTSYTVCNKHVDLALTTNSRLTDKVIVVDANAHEGRC